MSTRTLPTRGRGARAAIGASVAVLAVAVSACGAAASGSTSGDGKVSLTLGYFPNITHATALVGVDKGIFADALGSDVSLRTRTFNAGPAAVEAVFSGAVDATYVGPNPAINAFVRSHGSAVRIISGAASGGAALVVRPDITTVDDLRGKTLATPQLGNTQDVALRYWLRRQGLETDTQGGGDVHITPQDNAQTVETFAAKQIDGAWVPEPYASRLVLEGHGRVLVDERTLWPAGRFVTTQLIVRTDFLDKHPDVVRRLLTGQVKANDYLNAHPAEAQQAANSALKELTGRQVKPAVLAAAWRNLTFTNDPVAASLRADAEHAKDVGVLGAVDLDGIYDLAPLNEVLANAGEAKVSDR